LFSWVNIYTSCTDITFVSVLTLFIHNPNPNPNIPHSIVADLQSDLTRFGDVSPVSHSKPYLKDKQREANWDSRGKHPLPITRSIQEAERLPGGKYYIPLKRKKNDYETPITGAPLGEIGTDIMSLFLCTSILCDDDDGDEYTNLYLLCFLLFLFIYSSLSPSFSLPSLSHYTLIVTIT
jgi:hypothetical protein